jgi:hypothetical protein
MHQYFSRFLLITLLFSHVHVSADVKNNSSHLLGAQTYPLASSSLKPVQYGSSGPSSSIRELDGEWYSSEWKYGYYLNNGVGTATFSNSPYFKSGDRIIFLTPSGYGTYQGRQIYRDGNFYSIEARLVNGRLCIYGERNVSWCMAKIGR